MSTAPSTTGQPGRLRTIWDIAYSAGDRVGKGGTDRAAAMAYYAVLAVFPGVFVVVFISLIFTTEDSITDLIDWAVREGLDPSLAHTLRSTISAAVERARGVASIAAAFAAVAAISGASGWFAAAGRAIEPDPAQRKPRNLITGRVRSFLWTFLMLVLLVLALAMLASSGEVADRVFRWFGRDAGAPPGFGQVRLPLLVVGIVGAVLLIYRVAPDRRHPTRYRHLLPGALIAGIGWIVVSMGFFFYIANLANIGATYGAFATPVVLLIWLWLTGVVVLFGAEVNAELARRRGEHPGLTALPGADDPDIAGHPAGRLPEPEGDDTVGATYAPGDEPDDGRGHPAGRLPRS